MHKKPILHPSSRKSSKSVCPHPRVHTSYSRYMCILMMNESVDSLMFALDGSSDVFHFELRDVVKRSKLTRNEKRKKMVGNA